MGDSQIPAASRSSQCAAGHDGHLGNATTKTNGSLPLNQTGQTGKPSPD